MIPSVAVDRDLRAGEVPRWLWLRYVNGFDDRAHCAPCLLGHRSKRVGIEMPHGKQVLLIEHSTPFLYLCGGFHQYDWNLHVAMAPEKEGAFSVTAHNGAVFSFRGLRRLPIPSLPRGFNRYADSKTTCRNFQFGYSVFRAQPSRALPSGNDGRAAVDAASLGPGQIELPLK